MLKSFKKIFSSLLENSDLLPEGAKPEEARKNCLNEGSALPEDIIKSYLLNNDITDQQIYANEVGLYRVVVTDQFGCTGSDSAYLKLCPKEFLVPNAFTPNSDGINEVFRVVWNFDEVPTSFRMLIYNQWGTLVFTGTDIFQGWDGTTPDGNLCPVGVYTYYLFVEKPAGKSPAQQSSVRGIVTLVR